MEENEIKCLVEQIRCILLDKPQPPELKLQDPEFAELQGALDYLAACLQESNEFLNHLQRGVLDVETPGRDNFLAGHLKELHSALRYLTWQANQVANGDYNQTVHFLGDFSASFNRMTRQLAEREAQLKEKTIALEQTAHMMRSVMDSLHEWILVCDKEQGDILYANQSAQQELLEGNGGAEACAFLERLGQYRADAERNNIWEYQDPDCKRTFRINSYELMWEDTTAYSHLIVDVTTEKEHQKKMQGLAYADELTGLYNRHFCMETLEGLLEQKMRFSCCMIDVDGLKFANDNFGHEGGDEYLKTVAREIQNIIRSTDVACRIGGDEFVIILPNCGMRAAQNKMERLDQIIIGLSGRFPMSVSCGVSYVEGGETVSAQEVIEQADERMYAVKSAKKATSQNQNGIAFTWSNELITGNLSMDMEHKTLAQISNQLLQACSMGKSRDELSAILTKLIDYANLHFMHEETMQIQSQYPGYEYHKQTHMMFMQLLGKLADRLEKEGPTNQLIMEMNQRLCVWLSSHIKLEDAQVAAHLIQWEKSESNRESAWNRRNYYELQAKC